MSSARISTSLSGCLIVTGLLAVSAAWSGCGNGGEGGGGGHDAGPALMTTPGAPAAPAHEPDSASQTVDGYAAALAANGGLVVAGTSTRVYRVDATSVTPLEIVGDEPDLPAETGAVRALAAYAGGVLVAAEQGVFFTDGAALQLSMAEDALKPLDITAMTARVVPGAEGGPGDTQLALLAGGGGYELADGALTQWKVDGEDGAPTAIFAQEARVVLAFGTRVYEIDKASKKALLVPFALGEVREIACASQACDEGSTLYLASDAGLVERAGDGSYRLYPLAAAGQPAVPVESFALDSQRQRLYAVAGTSLLRVRAGEVPDAVATLSAPADHPRRVAVDASGDAWLGDGLNVTRWAIGTPLSFATDVRPIFHEYCADCHATGQKGAPVRDFESYDVAKAQIATVLMRVSDRSMPPVSYGKVLPAEKIEILQSWSVNQAP